MRCWIINTYIVHPTVTNLILLAFCKVESSILNDWMMVSRYFYDKLELIYCTCTGILMYLVLVISGNIRILQIYWVSSFTSIFIFASPSLVWQDRACFLRSMVRWNGSRTVGFCILHFDSWTKKTIKHQKNHYVPSWCFSLSILPSDIGRWKHTSQNANANRRYWYNDDNETVCAYQSRQLGNVWWHQQLLRIAWIAAAFIQRKHCAPVLWCGRSVLETIPDHPNQPSVWDAFQVELISEYLCTLNG